MYFAIGSNSIQFRMYHNLLNDYLAGKKNVETKKLFDEIIKSTHFLITGVKKPYEIDPSIYDIVLPIYTYSNIPDSYNRMYFLEVKTENITEDQYRTLNGILSSLISLDEIQPV